HSARALAGVDLPRRDDGSFRFLTVTNSHDLNRYGTEKLIDAYDRAFRNGDDVTLLLKDYGAAVGNSTIREALARRAGGARIVYITEFTPHAGPVQQEQPAHAFSS